MVENDWNVLSKTYQWISGCQHLNPRDKQLATCARIYVTWNFRNSNSQSWLNAISRWRVKDTLSISVTVRRGILLLLSCHDIYGLHHSAKQSYLILDIAIRAGCTNGRAFWTDCKVFVILSNKSTEQSLYFYRPCRSQTLNHWAAINSENTIEVMSSSCHILFSGCLSSCWSNYRYCYSENLKRHTTYT